MMIDHCHFKKILAQNNVQNKKGKYQPVDLAFSGFHEPFFFIPNRNFNSMCLFCPGNDARRWRLFMAHMPTTCRRWRNKILKSHQKPWNIQIDGTWRRAWIHIFEFHFLVGGFKSIHVHPKPFPGLESRGLSYLVTALVRFVLLLLCSARFWPGMVQDWAGTWHKSEVRDQLVHQIIVIWRMIFLRAHVTKPRNIQEWWLEGATVSLKGSVFLAGELLSL